jgi:PilZ domain
MLGDGDPHDAALLDSDLTESAEHTVDLPLALPSVQSGLGRRLEPRYAAVEDRLWIEWREADNFYGRSARLVNVSRHGAMVVASVPLRQGQRLRLYLEEPAPQDPVFAIVVGVVEGRSGFHQLRLHFPVPCPDAFIDAAAVGFEKWLSRGHLTA